MRSNFEFWIQTSNSGRFRLTQRLYSYAKIEGLEEDEGLDPRNLIHDKICKRGPFFTKYVVCTCSTLLSYSHKFGSIVFTTILRVQYVFHRRFLIGQIIHSINYLTNQKASHITSIPKILLIRTPVLESSR